MMKGERAPSAAAYKLWECMPTVTTSSEGTNRSNTPALLSGELISLFFGRAIHGTPVRGWRPTSPSRGMWNKTRDLHTHTQNKHKNPKIQEKKTPQTNKS